jgi:hypothetical protein
VTVEATTKAARETIRIVRGLGLQVTKVEQTKRHTEVHVARDGETLGRLRLHQGSKVHDGFTSRVRGQVRSLIRGTGR